MKNNAPLPMTSVISAFEARLAAGIPTASGDDADEADAPPPRVEVNKPDISRLPNAVDGGVALFGPGDRIIIERHATVLKGSPYLDTRTYKVKSLDPDTGNLILWDESLLQWARGNYITGIKEGQVFKLANDLKGSPGRKRRGRPRKNFDAPAPAPVATDTDGNPIKKKRGRPPGIKNRSKDIIKAEKVARKELKAAKRAAKERA